MRKLLILLGLLWVLPALAQFPISKLPPATLPLSGAEIVPMTQAGASKQTAISNIFAVAPPLAAAFLLEAPNALIPNSRTLAGTANEVILTDGGALGSLTLSTPQAIGTASNVTFASLLLNTPLTGANGGTSNAFFSVTGPATTVKTYTFPNVSSTVLTNNAAVTVPQGGTGLATLPAHTVLLGEAAANVGNVAAMALDTLLQGQGATNDPAAIAINNCSATNQGLSYSTSSHVFGCNTVTSANPAATVGLTAINGTATTFMTSDSAPALSQTISPTMTGTWTFSPSAATTSISSATTGTTPVVHITGSGTSSHTVLIDAPAVSSFMLEGPNVGGTGGQVYVVHDTTTALDKLFLGDGGAACAGLATTDACIAPGTGGTLQLGTAGGGGVVGPIVAESTSTSVTLPYTTGGANCSVTGTNGTLILRRTGHSVQAISSAGGTCTTAATGALTFPAIIPALYLPARTVCPVTILIVTAGLVVAQACINTAGNLSLALLSGTSTSFSLSATSVFTYGLD